MLFVMGPNVAGESFPAPSSAHTLTIVHDSTIRVTAGFILLDHATPLYRQVGSPALRCGMLPTYYGTSYYRISYYGTQAQHTSYNASVHPASCTHPTTRACILHLVHATHNACMHAPTCGHASCILCMHPTTLACEASGSPIKA